MHVFLVSGTKDLGIFCHKRRAVKLGGGCNCCIKKYSGSGVLKTSKNNCILAEAIKTATYTDSIGTLGL